MKSPPDNHGRLSVIDRIFSIMETHQRPQDFTLLLHLKNAPGLDALRAGANSARNLYPTTGSIIQKQRWIRCVEPNGSFSTISDLSNKETAKAITEFVDRPLDLRRKMPVQQLAITNGKSVVRLVTRFHHAAADGASAALWLNHQSRVAREMKAPVSEAFPFENLTLRRHESPVKQSRFAHRGASQALWSSHAKASRARRWRTIEIAGTDLREGCRKVAHFSYNDLLATCALQLFTQWNRLHGNGRPSRVGLWLPVNIRPRSVAGFGNGTSRIRLYAHDNHTSLLEKCRQVRRQIFWSNRHGEWAVPEKFPLASWPAWAIDPLVRAYCNRRGIDMGTGVFSHVEAVAGETAEVFEQLEKIESIGLLHARHSLAINGVTRGARTWMTFTYDPSLLSDDDIDRMVEIYQEQLDAARREFQ